MNCSRTMRCEVVGWRTCRKAYGALQRQDASAGGQITSTLQLTTTSSRCVSRYKRYHGNHMYCLWAKIPGGNAFSTLILIVYMTLHQLLAKPYGHRGLLEMNCTEKFSDVLRTCYSHSTTFYYLTNKGKSSVVLLLL